MNKLLTQNASNTESVSADDPFASDDDLSEAENNEVYIEDDDDSDRYNDEDEYEDREDEDTISNFTDTD